MHKFPVGVPCTYSMPYASFMSQWNTVLSKTQLWRYELVTSWCLVWLHCNALLLWLRLWPYVCWPIVCYNTSPCTVSVYMHTLHSSFWMCHVEHDVTLIHAVDFNFNMFLYIITSYWLLQTTMLSWKNDKVTF